MSWVTPAWVIAADSVIHRFYAGFMTLEDAEKELDRLKVPDSMKDRLYDGNKGEREW